MNCADAFAFAKPEAEASLLLVLRAGGEKIHQQEQEKKMIRISTIIKFLCFFFFSLSAIAQHDMPTEETFRISTNHSPLDYLKILKDDFKKKRRVNVFGIAPASTDWVKEEHIPGLLKLIYSTDSTRSIVNVFSSYLSTEKFSSIGLEAQNLIESFRSKKSYPLRLNSYGQPSKEKGEEIENWWKDYSLMQGVWWQHKEGPTALFLIKGDSLYYTEELQHPYLVKIKGGKFSMTRDNHESVYRLKTLTKDSLVFVDEDIGDISLFKKR